TGRRSVVRGRDLARRERERIVPDLLAQRVRRDLGEGPRRRGLALVTVASVGRREVVRIGTPRVELLALLEAVVHPARGEREHSCQERGERKPKGGRVQVDSREHQPASASIPESSTWV